MIAAGAIAVVFTVAAFVLPWARYPTWTWAIVPLAYIAAIALIGDAQHGMALGLTFLYVLPLLWLTLYGRWSLVVIGSVATLGALAVPIIVVGAPDYPVSEWHVVVIGGVVGLVSSITIMAIVQRDRGYAAELADLGDRRTGGQAGARDRQPTGLAAAGSHRHHGHRDRRRLHRDLLLGGGRTPAGLSGPRGRR